MSREETWNQAKKRVKEFARAKRPETLSILQSPDDADQGEESLTQEAETLVAIDSPDDYYVHQPETLGIEDPADKGKKRQR